MPFCKCVGVAFLLWAGAIGFAGAQSYPAKPSG